MKGGAFEVLDLIPVFVILIVSIGFGMYGTTRVNERVETLLLSLDDAPTTEITGVFDKLDASNTSIKNTLTFVIFGLMLVSLLFSYLVRHNPIFIILAIVVLVGTIFVATVFKTAMDRIYLQVPELQDYMINSSFFWSHFIEIITVWGLANVLMMFLGAVKSGEAT